MGQADRLKAWRKLADLSQEAAAERVQVSQSCWAAWECGVKTPGLQSALAIEAITEGAVKAVDWTAPRTKPRRFKRAKRAA